MTEPRWHKERPDDGTPRWFAEVAGEIVAVADMTGRAGVDNYPWDWHLVTARGGAGVADTLRSAKAYVARALTEA